jgi:predicted nucleic acid-binding protein
MSVDQRSLLAFLTEAIQDARVAIIGPIRQEVLSGIKERAQFERLRAAPEGFPDEPITSSHFEEAARLFNLCRDRCVECGSTEILIFAVAIEMNWTILTYDQGLKQCTHVLNAEGLIQQILRTQRG